ATKEKESFTRGPDVDRESHTSATPRFAARRRRSIRNAVYAPVRVRSTFRNPCFLSCESRPHGSSGRNPSDADACGRYRDLTFAHHAGRSHWTAAHVDCWRDSHGWCRSSVRFDKESTFSNHRGNHRGHQPEWARGRTVSFD